MHFISAIHKARKVFKDGHKSVVLVLSTNHLNGPLKCFNAWYEEVT